MMKVKVARPDKPYRTEKANPNEVYYAKPYFVPLMLLKFCAGDRNINALACNDG